VAAAVIVAALFRSAVDSVDCLVAVLAFAVAMVWFAVAAAEYLVADVSAPGFDLDELSPSVDVADHLARYWASFAKPSLVVGQVGALAAASPLPSVS
jgi:hypothetical protein